METSAIVSEKLKNNKILSKNRLRTLPNLESIVIVNVKKRFQKYNIFVIFRLLIHHCGVGFLSHWHLDLFHETVTTEETVFTFTIFGHVTIAMMLWILQNMPGNKGAVGVMEN